MTDPGTSSQPSSPPPSAPSSPPPREHGRPRQIHAAGEDGRQGRPKLDRLVLAANLAFIGVAVLCLIVLGLRSGGKDVQPLVRADNKTAQRIGALEQSLQRDPANVGSALELARLYQEVGEFPWSYDALRNAERTGSQDYGWRLKLGLAYLELAKNDDGLRVLEEASGRCLKDPVCPANQRAKLEIFSRIARLFVLRKIDQRKQRGAAEAALREVLRPVQVDPAKMRPKGPASAPVPGSAPTGSAAEPGSGLQAPESAPGAAR